VIFTFFNRGKVILNPGLEEAVLQIQELALSSDNGQELVYVPSVPIHLAFIGKRLAGQRMLALKVATHYNLTMISIDDLLRENG
jgi:hypothetical protein